jgi:tetratricopeptide (TPR) repeat protein
MVIQAAGGLDLAFMPGAVAAMYVSSDARSFRQPPEGWRPGTNTEFAGTNQSLTGDLVKQGVTGAAGHVAEPYLAAAIRPDVLFPAYLSGLNLAEAFYAAMPYLSWQTVVIGDPLCAPFRLQPLDPSQLDAPVDSITQLPGFFTQHRMQSPARGEVTVEAWKLFIRGEYLASRGETAQARDVLERATLADDRLVGGHLALAAMAQARSDWDEAINRFRRVVARQANHIVALNDLAYVLAEHKGAAEEALPLASRAYQLSKGVPDIADTYAWTLHLLDRHADAAPIIRQAAKALPGNAEIQWHAAVILAAVNDNLGASAALDAAVRANPTLSERAAVRTLRSRLQNVGK